MTQEAGKVSTCCNGTGYADYAAVPCPNPKCPVPVSDLWTEEEKAHQ